MSSVICELHINKTVIINLQKLEEQERNFIDDKDSFIFIR